MRIAIATPTGHIGSKVTRRLISAGAEVVLLARDLGKVKELIDQGAQARQGSLDDGKFLTDAIHGADALLWVTPPNMTSADVRGFQATCGRSAAQAIRANRIGRVVNISSIGAHLGKGTGLVNGLHDVEQSLEAVSANIVHLRAGWFFENLFMQLNAIRDHSSFFLPMDGSTRLPMIATRDIALAAGEALLDESWRGRHIRGLHGPADLSLSEAAEILSRGLGQTVRYVKSTPEQTRRALRLSGASDDFIDLMLEMCSGLESGWMSSAEPRSAATTTLTTLEQFAREEMAPALREEFALSGV